MINTIWFRFELTIFQKNFFVCRYTFQTAITVITSYFYSQIYSLILLTYFYCNFGMDAGKEICLCILSNRTKFYFKNFNSLIFFTEWKLDCNDTFAIDLEPNGTSFGIKSIEKRYLQSNLCSRTISRWFCVCGRVWKLLSNILNSYFRQLHYKCWPCPSKQHVDPHPSPLKKSCFHFPVQKIVQGSETHEKSISQFLRFLVFEVWSVVQNS